MKIDILTLFPDMFRGPFDMSMLLKAQQRGLAEITIHDLRQYGLGSRRTVDDTPFGGGDGMVLKPEPVVTAIENLKQKNPDSKVIMMSARGRTYDQQAAADLATEKGLILLCGHYEGFDERILDWCDVEVCVGDYVLTGGELPAMVVVDSVVRLLPGVLGGEQSVHIESFKDGLLEYPQYTRPVDFRGKVVPEVLRQGHHAEIEAWRQQKALEKTKRNRPDLLK